MRYTFSGLLGVRDRASTLTLPCVVLEKSGAERLGSTITLYAPKLTDWVLDNFDGDHYPIDESMLLGLAYGHAMLGMRIHPSALKTLVAWLHTWDLHVHQYVPPESQHVYMAPALLQLDDASLAANEGGEPVLARFTLKTGEKETSGLFTDYRTFGSQWRWSHFRNYWRYTEVQNCFNYPDTLFQFEFISGLTWKMGNAPFKLQFKKHDAKYLVAWWKHQVAQGRFRP